MSRRAGRWLSYGDPASRMYTSLALATLFLLLDCARENRARVGQDLRFGPYTLRVTSVEAYTRAHQGVPFEVEMRLWCEGGNRFERHDFADALSRKGGIYFSTAQGWRERGWLLARGDDFHEFVIHANPPPNNTGMTLEIPNPQAQRGGHSKILVNLGR